MNKKIMTIGMIAAGVIILVLIVIGLLTKTDGVYGWKRVLSVWQSRPIETESSTNPTTDNATSQTDGTTGASSDQSVANGSQSSTGKDSTGVKKADGTTPKSSGSTSAGGSGGSTGSTGSTGGSTGGSTAGGGSTGGGGTPTPTPDPTPPPAPSCSSGGSCTAAQVAAHTAKSDCWVILASKVYNVTAFIPNHPGGQGVFTTSVCGHDITAYLAGTASSNGSKHKHSTSAYNILNSYWYANLI